MPKFLEVSDPAAARTAIGLSGVVLVSHHVDGAATYEAAIAAAITEAGVNGVVDFEGVSYVTTASVTVNTAGITLQNGGITPTGQFPALSVTADRVTVANMTFSRSQSASVTATTAQRACLVVNGEDFTSDNCRYLSTNMACVYLTHGGCDGAVIRGGEMTGSAAVQNGCGVYAAAGSTGNRNITVTDVYIHDTTDGVLLYDTSDSHVANNRVESLRKLPTVTLTGWTLVAGNIYRQRSASGTPGVDGVSGDRVDGTTTTVTVTTTKYPITSFSSTTPAENQATISDGYLYINLGGTDPGTLTITSDIVSAYAYTVYVSSSAADESICSRNKITNNTADDVDGFGIYFQLGGVDDPGGVGNQAVGNTLTNVCLEGVQLASLPFGGIGVVGGNNTVLAGNLLDVVGSAGKTAPGVTVWQGTAAESSGSIVATSVTNSVGRGFDIRSSNYSLSDCHSRDNGNDGFFVYSRGGGDSGIIENVTFNGCQALNNGGDGFYINGDLAGVDHISATIIGGVSVGNARRGVYIHSSASSATVTDCTVTGMRIADNAASASYNQVFVNNMAARTTITGCSFAHDSSATGILVAAAATDTLIEANQYDLSTPETLNAEVLSSVADRTTAATSKTTPADADLVPLVDSAADNVLKKLTWSNLLAAVKTYYDSVTAVLTNKTLTDPKINAVKDTNGNSIISMTPTASAVNYFDVQNKAAGGGAIGLLAAGSDSSIPIAVWPKGTGGFQVRSSTAGVYLIAEPVTSGVNFLVIKNAATTASPTINCAGSDTNVGVDFVPKGTGTVTVSSNPVGVKVAVPANASATGVPGQWAAESGWLYICVAANTWERVAIASW